MRWLKAFRSFSVARHLVACESIKNFVEAQGFSEWGSFQGIQWRILLRLLSNHEWASSIIGFLTVTWFSGKSTPGVKPDIS